MARLDLEILQDFSEPGPETLVPKKTGGSLGHEELLLMYKPLNHNVGLFEQHLAQTLRWVKGLGSTADLRA